MKQMEQKLVPLYNLIIGDQHSYEGFAGLIAGKRNHIQGEYSSITGGKGILFGNYSVISGGFENIGSGNHAAILGGYQNETSNSFASISGGGNNWLLVQNLPSLEEPTMSRLAVSSILGGDGNETTGLNTTISAVFLGNS